MSRIGKSIEREILVASEGWWEEEWEVTAYRYRVSLGDDESVLELAYSHVKPLNLYNSKMIKILKFMLCAFYLSRQLKNRTQICTHILWGSFADM